MTYARDELDEVYNEAFSEGYAEGHAEGRALVVLEMRQLLDAAAELLDGARCSFLDPSLRMSWGRRRRDLLDEMRKVRS